VAPPDQPVPSALLKEADLENRVLRIVDRVLRGEPVESSCVELKTIWMPPKEAARAIGAMCNAAGGEPVLFLVGVDEKSASIPGVPVAELADWWARVQREFDREAPGLEKSLAVHIAGATVMALLFDTTRAPFVVNNPVNGLTGSGPVKFEVPWREGNATRSARREDLIRLLVPAVKLPELEVIDADAMFYSDGGAVWNISATLEVYAIARVRTILIGHRSSVVITPKHLGPADCRLLRRTFGEQSWPDPSPPPPRDVVLDRPGSFQFVLEGPTSCIGPVLPTELSIAVEFGMADSTLRPAISARLVQVPGPEGIVQYEMSTE
jgi:hypothetical protein